MIKMRNSFAMDTALINPFGIDPADGQWNQLGGFRGGLYQAEALQDAVALKL
jgi:hypothetical protein